MQMYDIILPEMACRLPAKRPPVMAPATAAIATGTPGDTIWREEEVVRCVFWVAVTEKPDLD